MRARVLILAVLLAVMVSLAGQSCFAQTSKGTGGSEAAPKTGAKTNGASKAAASPADVAAGQGVFKQRCEVCHYSESTAEKIGPGLKGFHTRKKFANGENVDDAAVIHWIEAGDDKMPGFKAVLKPDQIRSLVAYLKSL